MDTFITQKLETFPFTLPLFPLHTRAHPVPLAPPSHLNWTLNFKATQINYLLFNYIDMFNMAVYGNALIHLLS